MYERVNLSNIYLETVEFLFLKLGLHYLTVVGWWKIDFSVLIVKYSN